MTDIVKGYSTEALSAAIKANRFEYYETLGRSPRAERHQDAGLTWILTGIPHSFLNNILRTQFSSETVDDSIQQTLASLKSRNITRLSWWTEAGTQPIDLGEHLIAHGLTHDEGGTGMAVDLQRVNELPMPADLSIQIVEDGTSLRDFLQAASKGFGLSETVERMCLDLFADLGYELPLRHYIGSLHGIPVATSELFLGAGVAGIYWVSTVPEARRRGIGSAMTQAALREAREMGYRAGILHASEMGKEVYRQLGFEEHCRMSHYTWESE